MKSNKILEPRSASKMDYQERIGSPRAESLGEGQEERDCIA